LKKLRQKNFIYKILDFIYLLLKSISLFLVPYPENLRKTIRKIRRFRLTAFFLFFIFGFSLIVYFFLVYPIKDYGIDLASNQRFLKTYFEFQENIEDKVEAWRNKNYPEFAASEDYEKWSKGDESIFTINTEEITRINELNSTIRIKGTVNAQYRPESITSAYPIDDPIIIKARKDILSIADLNFASTEERRFEPIAPAVDISDGWRRSTYRFEGDFPLERDLKKFPFDKAIWRVRIIFPIEPYAINPAITGGSHLYNFSKINAFEPDYMICENPEVTDDYEKYINCTNFELFDRLNFYPEEYVDQENEYYLDAQLDYHMIVTVYGRLKRSLSSSFVRYLMPIIFSIMVLTLTDQLSSRESWEIKVATPPTVLLTLIFMQNTYHSQIPQLGYITWLDKLYLLAYLASILMLINAVISKGDWFNNRKIDLDARLKLNYLIRNVFVFVVIVMPFLTYLL
tara:strand:+ start:2476 stop:3846 length:1371 start_codon:yes stop_codon:yes gene_type:complete